MPHGWLWNDSSSPWLVLPTLCLMIKQGLFLTVDTFSLYLIQTTQLQSAGANSFLKNNNVNLVTYAWWAFGRGQTEFWFAIFQAQCLNHLVNSFPVGYLHPPCFGWELTVKPQEGFGHWLQGQLQSPRRQKSRSRVCKQEREGDRARGSE